MTLAKTVAGLRILKDRHGALSPRQRAALILFDGQRSLDDVLAATSAGGVTRDDIERLLHLGLVAELPPGAQPFRDSSPAGLERERYLHVYGIAAQLTEELGSKWGSLNLAVESAGSLEELEALAPRIRLAVGPVKFARLEAALKAR